MDTNSVQRQTALVGDPSKRGVVYIPILGKEYDQKYIENRTDPVLYFDLDLLKKSLPEKSGYRYFVPVQYTAEGNRFRCTNHFFYFDFPDETYDHINEAGQLPNNKTFSFAFPDCPGRTYFYPLWGEPTIIVSEKKAALTAISDIMKSISHNNTQLSDKDLAEWILETYTQRTKNHKSFVEAVASSIMKDYFGTQYNLYARYFDKILKHDNDKLDMTQPDMVASYAVNTVLMNPKHTNLYSVTDEAQLVFENVYWKKHYEHNTHHPENWAGWDQSTWKCSLDAFKKKFAEDPKEGFLAIAEMVTDWMAVGLEVGNTAKEWFAKANGQKWEWAPELVDELIIPMLAFEKPLYLSYETTSVPLLKEDISTEAMSLEPLTSDEKEMPNDPRFKQLVFLVKAVCHVKAYINPGSKLLDDLHITEKKYEKLAESIFRHFYCGKTDTLPKYNSGMMFKTLAKWVIDHLQEKPKKEEVSNEDLELFNESISNEVMQGEPSPKQKREKIIKLICDTCNKMEPEGKNAKRYKDWLGSMSDKEFDQFMQYMKEGKFQLFIVAPNMESNIKIENLLKAADFVGCNLFHKLWFTDSSTKRKYLSDNKYMILSLPIRRQQQFLDEKISVPENDKQIDGMTGQVTGDSKACSITNPEIHILAARNLDATLFEFLNVRGGNISGYNEFKRSLEENGDASLNDIDPNSRTRVSVVGNTLLKGLMIDNNL